MTRKQSNRNGAKPHDKPRLTQNQTAIGIVTMLVRGGCKVRVNGKIVDCIARDTGRPPGEPGLTVGDEVRLVRSGAGPYLLESILPRRTCLSKTDPRRPESEQPIATNIDLAILVVTIQEPPLKIRLVDRFLIAAKIGGVCPVICVNKIDLLRDEKSSPELASILAYRNLGVRVLICSAVTGRGVDRLARVLQDKRSVVIGQRGVGKTSLINALGRDLELPVSQLRPGRDRGKSATQQTMMIEPKPGMQVIDTSGLKDFGIRRMGVQELQEHFPEFDEYTSKCAYGDCTHTSEPDCAVRLAVRDGLISKNRYESYLKLMGAIESKGDSHNGRRPTTTNHTNTDADRTEGPFKCANCGEYVSSEDAGTEHRNHCPNCLYSLHLDDKPGDRAAYCGGLMQPIAVWVRHGGEWALIHRCRECGALSSNRIAADDNEILLLSLAVRPLSSPPFPLDKLEDLLKRSR